MSLVPDGLEATIVLLRHGESEYIVEGRFQGQAETPLSPLGRRQAELAAGRLARPHASPALPIPLGPPLEIVHSPLARTAETADAVATAMGASDGFGRPVACRPERGFREIGQGAWEGLLHSEIAERYAEALASWRRRPLEAWAPGGESVGEVAERVGPAVGHVISNLGEAGQAVDPARIDRPQVSGYGSTAPADHPWSIIVGHDGIFKVLLLLLFELPLDRFWTFPFALAGITVVDIGMGRATLRAHNLTEHLAPLLEERAQAVSEARERTGAL